MEAPVRGLFALVATAGLLSAAVASAHPCLTGQEDRINAVHDKANPFHALQVVIKTPRTTLADVVGASPGTVFIRLIPRPGTGPWQDLGPYPLPFTYDLELNLSTDSDVDWIAVGSDTVQSFYVVVCKRPEG
jgi:hypothetical protein